MSCWRCRAAADHPFASVHGPSDAPSLPVWVLAPGGDGRLGARSDLATLRASLQSNPLSLRSAPIGSTLSHRSSSLVARDSRCRSSGTDGEEASIAASTDLACAAARREFTPR